jgi:hypothetical protein
MAYVKMTGEFKDRVRGRINRMKDKELEQYQIHDIKAGSALAIEVSATVVDNAWGDYLDLKDKMPLKWCVNNMGHTTVEFLDSNGSRVHRTNMDLDGLKFPPTTSRYGSYPKVSVDQCGKVVKDWLAGIATAETNIQVVEEKFNTIRTQIQNFMLKHTSLNTAVKELPELEMYVHEDDMERLRRKVVKYASAPSAVEEADEGIGVDAGLLASTAIAARISGMK